jgi:plasmid maintenance system antidote protein VapI
MSCNTESALTTGSCLYIEVMPTKSKPKSANFEKETLGPRLARIRKERGFTQQQLAERSGLIQVLISDYEHEKLRLTAEMAVRFADILGVSTDELLRGKKKSVMSSRRQPSLKLLRRMEQIENLPPYRQRALLTTIDGFLASSAQDR